MWVTRTLLDHHLSLKMDCPLSRGHSFEDNQESVLARDDCWFERGVKEAILVKLKKPSLNQGGGVRHFLSATYGLPLSGSTFKHSHCLTRPDVSPCCDPTDKGEGSQQKLGERPCQCLTSQVISVLMVPRALLSGSAPSELRTDEAFWKEDKMSSEKTIYPWLTMTWMN